MKIPILFLLSLFNISIQSEERGEIYRCQDGSYIEFTGDPMNPTQNRKNKY